MKDQKEQNMRPVVFKAPAALIQAMRAAVKRDGRTISGYVRFLIERDLKRRRAA